MTSRTSLVIGTDIVALAFTQSAALATAQNIMFLPFQTENSLWRVKVGNEANCIGQSANRCMRNSPEGDTTAAMNACTDGELQYWDKRLNTAYQALIERFTTLDAQNQTDGYDVASAEDALREMQRAWIPFRDTACQFDRVQFGNGTLGSTMQLAYLLDETGRQALRLERELAIEN